MNLKPAYWSHHHTHRLFHISLGLCFGFIALTIVSGMATALLNANASGLPPQSGDIQIFALVEGVNPGVISGGSSINPTPTANPTISIVAEPQGQIPVQNNAYVFPTQLPAFSGVTSVVNGLIFITITGQSNGSQSNLNSTTQADANGHWYWQSPQTLSQGNYQISAAVFDSVDLTRSGHASVNFAIQIPSGNPPPVTQPGIPTSPGTPPLLPPELPPTTPSNPPSLPGQALFGAFIKVLPDYKSVTAGTKVVAAVSLLSNKNQTQVSNQELDFKVYSPAHKLILQSRDMVSFSQHSDYLKTFGIAPATPEGQYTIVVSAIYQGITSTASDTFQITQSTPTVGQIATPNIPSQWPAMVWALLLLLLLLFIVLTIMAYHQIKHHSQEINNSGMNA